STSAPDSSKSTIVATCCHRGCHAAAQDAERSDSISACSIAYACNPSASQGETSFLFPSLLCPPLGSPIAKGYSTAHLFTQKLKLFLRAFMFDDEAISYKLTSFHLLRFVSILTLLLGKEPYP
ncbi:hypothetical protein MPER_09565, partial [Moniliophthora perniciosa FA553]